MRVSHLWKRLHIKSTPNFCYAWRYSISKKNKKDLLNLFLFRQKSTKLESPLPILPYCLTLSSLSSSRGGGIFIASSGKAPSPKALPLSIVLSRFVVLNWKKNWKCQRLYQRFFVTIFCHNHELSRLKCHRWVPLTHSAFLKFSDRLTLLSQSGVGV